MLTHNLSRVIPDEIIKLCCQVFESYEAALAASPIAGIDQLRWMTLPQFPVIGSSPIEESSYHVHSVRIDRIAPGQWVWRLTREDDRDLLKLIRSEFML